MIDVAVCGVPRAGKSTYADQLAGVLGGARRTDDLVDGFEWSDASEAASHWLDEPAGIVEGVTVVRALRKWLRRNPEGKPARTVVWMGAPRTVLNEGQRRMAKGCATIWAEVRPELERRGVEVRET